MDESIAATVKPTLNSLINQDDGASSYECRKLTMEEWRQHVKQNHTPYRRDCRLCVEDMGQGLPHIELAYSLSADVVGPFKQGWDYGRGRDAKYAILATIPVPLSEVDLKEEEKEEEDPLKNFEDEKELEVEGLETYDEEEDEEKNKEEEARKEETKEVMDAATRPIKIQNVTLPNRQDNEVAKALDKLRARYRATRQRYVFTQTERRSCCGGLGGKKGHDPVDDVRPGMIQLRMEGLSPKFASSKGG